MSKNDARNNEIAQKIRNEAQAARDRKVDPKDIAARQSTMLWADKHKPQKLDELLGNGGHIRNLKNWLAAWDRRHVKKTESLPNYNAKGNPGRRLQMGHVQGIGKRQPAVPFVGPFRHRAARWLLRTAPAIGALRAPLELVYLLV